MSARFSHERSLWLCFVLCAGVSHAHVSLAQKQAGSVGLLRDTDPSVQIDVVGAVDEALLRGLAELAGIEGPTVSPVEYEEVQLAVGCEGESRECLSSIAQTLQVDSVVVRRLSRDGAGITTLELVRFEGKAGQEVDSARATAPTSSESEVVAVVPRLVRELFHLPPAPEPPAPSSPDPVPVTRTEMPPAFATPVEDREVLREQGVEVTPLTWVTLLSGAAVLTAGAVVGWTADRSFDDLKHTTVRTPADAARVNGDFESIETRATIANVLMPVGGAALGLGIVLLALDLSSEHAPDRGGGGVALRVSPLGSGVAVTMRGAFGDE